MLATRLVAYAKYHGTWYSKLYEHGQLQEHHLHVARRFERFLDAYRRPGGSLWTGQKLVSRSYFTNLRKGRTENPGYEKMLAIARAMGFPPSGSSTRRG